MPYSPAPLLRKKWEETGREGKKWERREGEEELEHRGGEEKGGMGR